MNLCIRDLNIARIVKVSKAADVWSDPSTVGCDRLTFVITGPSPCLFTYKFGELLGGGKSGTQTIIIRKTEETKSFKFSL